MSSQNWFSISGKTIATVLWLCTGTSYCEIICFSNPFLNCWPAFGSWEWERRKSPATNAFKGWIVWTAVLEWPKPFLPDCHKGGNGIISYQPVVVSAILNVRIVIYPLTHPSCALQQTGIHCPRIRGFTVHSKYTNSINFYIYLQLTWSEAFQWCLSHKGVLADVKTKDDMDFLIELVRPLNYSNSRFWLGATNHGEGPKFIWVSTDGSNVDPKLFSKLGDQTNKNCRSNCIGLKLERMGDGIITNACHRRKFFICKYKNEWPKHVSS